MKKIQISILMLLLLSTILLSAQVSQISVRVEGDGYKKMTFAENALLWNNRTYTISGLPAGFNDFDFLQNSASIAEGGTIIPLADGKIYIICKESEGPGKLGAGWTLVVGSQFNYNANGTITPLVIFEHAVTTNSTITIPLATGFTGLTPIANTIDLQPVTIRGITLDGAAFNSFQERTLTYNYYLPYNSINPPVVGYTPYINGVTSVISQATNITGTLSERTAKVEVTALDNSKSIYKIIFDKLPQLDLYLCIGQSNMGGRGEILPEDEGVISGVWLLKDQNEMIGAENPLNYYSSIQGGVINKLNPAYTFSTNMRSLKPEQELGLISNARGATGLISWMPGTTYYTEAVKRAKWAMKFGTMKGVIWLQGEEDTKGTDNIPLYLDRIKTMITSLRTDLGDATLPFVASQICRESASYADFNTMILNLPGILPNTDVILSDGLSSIGDKVHFNNASQKIIGQRFSAKMYPMVYPAPTGNVTVERAGFLKKLFVEGKVIHVNCDLNSTYNVVIVDLTGKILYSKNNSSDETIDLSKFQTGIIIVKIQTGNDLFVQKNVLQEIN